MCFFRKKKNQPTPATVTTTSPKGFKVEKFTFQKLPESLEEFQNLPEAKLDTPYKTAALTMLALCVYSKDVKLGKELLNYLRGPRPLSTMDEQFLRDRFMDKGKYIPFSYFEGAKPENNYTPTTPYVVKIREHGRSFAEDGYASMELVSYGADSPRSIKLRNKPSTGEWFLWEQMVMVGIKPAQQDNPWA